MSRLLHFALSEERRRSIRTRWSAVSLLAQVDPLRTGLLAVVVAVSGVIPIAFTIASGTAVGAIPQAVQDGQGSAAFRTLVTSLAASALCYAFMQVADPLQNYVVWGFSSRFDTAMMSRVIESTTSPAGIQHLEDPNTLNQIANARGFTGWVSAGGSIGPMATIFGNYVQASVATVVLARFHVVYALLLFVVLLICRSIWRYETFRLYKVQTGQAHSLRHATYFRDLIMRSQAAKETRVFGLLSWIIERFRSHWLDAMREVWRDRRRGMRSSFGASALSWIPMALVFGALVRSAASGDVGLADFSIYSMAVFNVRSMYGLGTNELRTEFGQGTIPAILGLDEATAPAQLPGGRSDPGGLPREVIRFEDVSFTYPGTDRTVFSGLDLEIRHGESLAVVGANGAGKTTIVKLLCRLYDPNGGRITVDGIDLREFPPEKWQRRIGAIFQDFVHYPLSARTNVGFGDIDRLADDDAIRKAADLAGATGVIDQLSNGLDTILSRHFEGGADLSGGQWQRVALARAMMAASGGIGVLVLDEPTANLDVRGEAEIYGRFLELTHGKTTIVISHRFSTVRRADRICVLEDGRVVEQGSHDELIRAGGRYAEMFHLQAARFVEGAVDA